MCRRSVCAQQNVSGDLSGLRVHTDALVPAVYADAMAPMLTRERFVSEDNKPLTPSKLRQALRVRVCETKRPHKVGSNLQRAFVFETQSI